VRYGRIFYFFSPRERLDAYIPLCRRQVGQTMEERGEAAWRKRKRKDMKNDDGSDDIISLMS
jgi:hypothetical protein